MHSAIISWKGGWVGAFLGLEAGLVVVLTLSAFSALSATGAGAALEAGLDLVETGFADGEDIVMKLVGG